MRTLPGEAEPPVEGDSFGVPCAADMICPGEDVFRLDNRVLDKSMDDPELPTLLAESCEWLTSDVEDDSPDDVVCVRESAVVDPSEVPESTDCCEGSLIDISANLGAGSEGGMGESVWGTIIALS